MTAVYQDLLSSLHPTIACYNQLLSLPGTILNTDPKKGMGGRQIFKHLHLSKLSKQLQLEL